MSFVGRSQTGARSRRSMSATSVGLSRKEGKFSRSTKRGVDGSATGGRYKKLNDADNDGIEMMNLNMGDEGVTAAKNAYKSSDMKPHEIYENTSYIPNTPLRLLEVPMSSSLTFQKLLYFHGTFDIIYSILLILGQLHRIQVRHGKVMSIIVLALEVIWVPVEISRLRFGYAGNINETFPELIAFLIFTFVFIIPLDVAPLLSRQMLPHETCLITINLVFVIFECIFGCVVVLEFMSSHFASFKLRTAPIIDKKFSKKYFGSADINSEREVQIGMQRYDEQKDSSRPFKDSDFFNKTFGPHMA